MPTLTFPLHPVDVVFLIDAATRIAWDFSCLYIVRLVSVLCLFSDYYCVYSLKLLHQWPLEMFCMCFVIWCVLLWLDKQKVLESYLHVSFLFHGPHEQLNHKTCMRAVTFYPKFGYSVCTWVENLYLSCNDLLEMKAAVSQQAESHRDWKGAPPLPAPASLQSHNGSSARIVSMLKQQTKLFMDHFYK